MREPGGVVGRLERAQDMLVSASVEQLGRDTIAATARHDERVAAATGNAASQYFTDKKGQLITPEELALLHYLQSGSEDLPDDTRLGSRLEAAEQAFEVIAGADMLFLQSRHVDIEFVKLDTEKDKQHDQPEIRLDKIRSAPGGNGNLLGGQATITLPAGTESINIYSLIGEKDLATPIDTVEGVDALFRKRKGDIISTNRNITSGPHLPVIAGREPIIRYVADLGTKVALSKQETDIEQAEQFSFMGLTILLAGEDPELSRAIVEEAGEAKPKLLEAIHKAHEQRLQAELQYILKEAQDGWSLNEGPDVYIQELPSWFDSEAQLFYSPEEIQELKVKMLATYETCLAEIAKENATRLGKQVQEAVADLRQVLKA